MRGEKSNAMIAESQVDFHIGTNNAAVVGANHGQLQLHCILCGQPNANIELPDNGLVNNRLDHSEIYYRAKCVFYEPVLIEPLTFTNGAEFNPPMYNIDNFELTYNIDNLDNMIMIDKAKVMKILGCADTQIGGAGIGAATPGLNALNPMGS